MRARLAHLAHLAGGLTMIAVLAGCSEKSASAPGRGRCAEVTAVRVPEASGGLGRWGVELGLQGAVLARNGPRFEKRGITPNGEAWAGVIEQCLARHGERLSADVHLDPEAGALHAWVESDASKDRLVAVMCRAANDAAWLEGCLARVKRDALDD